MLPKTEFLGSVLNFIQSEARMHSFLASDWLKFGTLPQKYRTLYFYLVRTEVLLLFTESTVEDTDGATSNEQSDDLFDNFSNSSEGRYIVQIKVYNKNQVNFKFSFSNFCKDS